ncbi:protein RKD1-like [Vitis riparia]|uniref:protein RKD1-like n=1 Tax=Vitis riparia TaxID=96939 RepID=UPI00155A2393|nr:protein RKD1-like [Vitis riparia]
MAGQSLNGWAMREAVAKEEDPIFSFPMQPPSHEFSGYSELDFRPDFGIQDIGLDAVPLMESFPTDPLYSPLDIIPSPAVIQEDFGCGYGNELGGWNEMNPAFDHEKQPLLLCDKNGRQTEEESTKENKATRKGREEKSNSSKMLSRNTISQYFYMPITQAARELKVGLTLLKKRCRELGIRRWPHRKLMSLQTLIKNVQELGKDEGDGSDQGKLREAIQILEQERKLMEEMPDLQLEDKTKRLRQAYFKANYKKRKLMDMMDSSQSSSNSNPQTVEVAMNYTTMDEEDEMKSLLSDSFSSTNMML